MAGSPDVCVMPRSTHSDAPLTPKAMSKGAVVASITSGMSAALADTIPKEAAAKVPAARASVLKADIAVFPD